MVSLLSVTRERFLPRRREKPKFLFPFTLAGLAWDPETESCPSQLSSFAPRLATSRNHFSFLFLLSLLPLSRYRAKTGRVARVRIAISYSSIVDKEKRFMKYYAARKYMAAHAALPLIRTRENRPFRSRGARWTANSARCNVISFDILFPSTVRTFAPYLASRHFHSLSRPSPSRLLAPVRSYLMYDAASSSDVPLVWYSTLTTRHFRCGSGLVLGLRVGRDITWSMDPSSDPGRYVFVPRIRKILP